MVILFFVVLIGGVLAYDYFFGEESSEQASGDGQEIEGDCNVAGLNLHGEILTYIPKEEASYHFFRNDKNAQFTVWINGKEIFFGPSNQKLPDLRDFLRVRVQLSPSASSDNTVRFVVVKPD